MKHKPSNGRGMTGVSFLFFIIAAVVLTFQPWAGPIAAQEQKSAVEKSPDAAAPSTPPAVSEKPSPDTAATPPAPEAQKSAEQGKTKAETQDSESESKGASAEELSNQSCLECHNPDILKLSKEELTEQVVVEGEPTPAAPKPRFVAGKLTLSIDEKEYAAGVHSDTTCVTCHKGVQELPHKMPLTKVDCKECHEESVDTIQASAHGDKADLKGPKGPGCIGCHDVHYGKAVSTYAKEFKKQICVDCHKAYGRDTNKDHRKLYEPGLHLGMACMTCHAGAGPGVHSIAPVKTRVAHCESCHTKFTMLSQEKKLPSRDVQYMKQTAFINTDALKKFGYMVGANRIPALDMILILVVLGPLALPVVHGGLRILTRRKGAASPA